ncbi:MAG TPA: CPBP family intramembrane glutamic endopeptidase [Planctomycetota bacterium]|nr:CPBP family intramembrane glutamic endopeptidase [Planctomycetota bacterium]
MRKLLQGFRSVDKGSAIALVYTAAHLSAIEFWFLTTVVQQRLDRRRRSVSLEAGATWSIATIVLEMLVPLLLIKLVHRRRILDHGWRLEGFFRHIWVYLGLYLLMVPVVYWASLRQDFMIRYPFVPEARKDFAVFLKWEAFYLAQFFALESFFRGYLLFTLERSFGWNACFIMAVPYCAIHWHKAPLECFAAIFAGVFLGGMALRFRSWYGGAVLHSLVAVTMDGLAFARAAG